MSEQGIDLTALRQRYGSGAWAARTMLGSVILGDGLGHQATGPNYGAALERLESERAGWQVRREKAARDFSRARRIGKAIELAMWASVATVAALVLRWAWG